MFTSKLPERSGWRFTFAPRPCSCVLLRTEVPLDKDGRRRECFYVQGRTAEFGLDAEPIPAVLQIRKGPGKDAGKNPRTLQKIADLTLDTARNRTGRSKGLARKSSERGSILARKSSERKQAQTGPRTFEPCTPPAC